MSTRELTTPQIAVNECLARFGVSFEVKSVAPSRGFGPQPIDRDGWKCFPWHVTFQTDVRPGKCFTTDYFTGVGIVNERGVASRPVAADVLHSLLLDGQAAHMSFDDWCGEYGYDTDSMKAFRTYEACCKVGRDLERVLTREQCDELSALLQDY